MEWGVIRASNGILKIMIRAWFIPGLALLLQACLSDHRPQVDLVRPSFAIPLRQGFGGQEASEAKPNILFIIADDQAPQSLKAYGNRVCHTPNIDRLAREGMVLDGAHHMGAWAGGVCTPSRHMIMSGRTVWHIPDKPKGKKANNKATGRNPNEADPNLVPPDLVHFTMPAVFNRGLSENTANMPCNTPTTSSCLPSRRRSLASGTAISWLSTDGAAPSMRVGAAPGACIWRGA